MTNPLITDDLTLALTLAEIADAISLARFQAHDLIISIKPDRSQVTDADKAVERAISDRLQQERPNDSILGEEYGTVEAGSHSASPRARTGHRQWVIDPIDGTANFMRGVPGWATLISLEVDRVPQLGVVSAPATDTRWWATRGGGAWKEVAGEVPQRLRVSAIEQLGDAWLSFQSLAQWDQAGHLDTLVELSRKTWRDRAFGDSWSYMLLAEGLIDITAEFDVKPYDLSAVVTIVEEAGGRFSSIDGSPGAWQGNSLATNGLLHSQVLEIFNR
ncbi:inositol monophosphatase family protein [Lysinibacter sp. HNR]|uniref:inositol monophosphatase family protein n=1 Tax=Lysinibacter sp. HNR TaxID=3031408 RepID=UPI0024360120|nr:inositol monophosphatase family protein [Lysinibacter sp. HNR]WGD36658.1 inositol monophosphatase family protein [Lysinibacter sp. HNR]